MIVINIVQIISNNMFITIKRRIPKDIKIKLGMLFTSVCFVAKMRLGVNRFRKRKLLIKEWIDLQKNNLLAISTIKQKTQQLQFNKSKADIILHGLEKIQDQSHRIIDKLTSILASKVIVFGKEIRQICNSFEIYFQYLKKYVERLMIIKQKNGQEPRGKYFQNQGNRLTLQENAQKIIYRTYQISILIAKYIKYLSKNSKDLSQFFLAQQIITNINKKFDRLIRQEQKQKQIQRLQKMIGEKINTTFIYTEKCYWHLGQINLHIFQLMIIIEEANRHTCLRLDKYCSIFIKFFENLKLVCLITNTITVHFLFNFSKQLTKFVKIVQANIQQEASFVSLLVSQTPYLFNPFLSAKIVDYQQQKSGKQEFTIIFSSICEDAVEQDRSVRISVARQSNLNWTEVGLNNEHQQELNERVALTLSKLLRIQKICELQYGLKIGLPKLQNFDNKVSQSCLTILQWQAYLNTILRSKTIINNPILILKQLQVSDIFLQASLSKSNISFEDNTKQHCKLCSRIVVTSLNRYFSQRLHFIFVKYSTNSKEYCYYIFQKVRQQICRISISKLNTCKQLIIWRQFRNGNIDYSFKKVVKAEKCFYVQVGMLQIKQQIFQIEITQHTLVSQVIDQICLVLTIPVFAGYRLLVYMQEQEVILRPNQLIFSVVETYNINYQKGYSSTFLSKIKSFGRSLQMSQKGNLVLKQIIYYPLSQAEQIQRQFLYNQQSFLFRQDKLIGLSKDSIFQLIALYSIRELVKSKVKEMPNSLSRKIYQKYSPGSVQQEVQQSNQLIQRIYHNYKNLQKSQIDRIIDKKLSTSQLYRKYVITIKIVQISENLSKGKRIKSGVVGIGWSQVVILTLNEKIITRFKWSNVSIILGLQGLKLSNDNQTILFKCSQLYQIYQILLQYKALTEQIVMIKSK